MLAEIEAGEAAGDRLAHNSVDGGWVIYLVDAGKIQVAEIPDFLARGEAAGSSKKTLNLLWWAVLEQARTFFAEHPDGD